MLYFVPLYQIHRRQKLQKHRKDITTGLRLTVKISWQVNDLGVEFVGQILNSFSRGTALQNNCKQLVLSFLLL